MQRHMQNISFLVIVGVLLSCAYFFSEQVRIGEKPQDATRTAIPTIETRENLPDCDAVAEGKDALACYQESAALSQRLVESLSDRILSQESESARRLAFVEMQQVWEKSRDADCEFVMEMGAFEGQGSLGWEKCLAARNLARLDQLEVYFCDMHGDVSCEASVQSNP